MGNDFGVRQRATAQGTHNTACIHRAYKLGSAWKKSHLMDLKWLELHDIKFLYLIFSTYGYVEEISWWCCCNWV